MYRLLIVDDEPVIVEGLLHLFQQVQDIELDICTAFSGNEALAWLHRTQIDIVLSDIQMPGLDGMQLMEEIQLRWPECRVIMFTGYSDFDYVYRSIRHEGVKYLLKSEGDEVIVNSIRTTINEIRNKLKAKEWMGLVEHQMKNELPLLQKEFMLDLLHDPAVAELLTDSQLAKLGIPLSRNYPIIPIIGRMDPALETIPIDEQTRQLYVFKQVIEQCMSDRFHLVLFSFKHMLWYVTLQPIQAFNHSDDPVGFSKNRHEAIMHAREALSIIQRICRETFELTVSFAHSNVLVAWKDFGRTFHNLNWLLDYRIGQEKQIILSEDFEEAFITYGISFERLKKMEGYLLARDHSAYIALIENLLGEEKRFIERGSYDYAEGYYTTAVYLLQMIQRWRITEKLSSLIDLHRLLQLAEYGSYAEMIDFYSKVGSCVIRLQEDEEADHVEKPIRFLKTYISTQVNQDLSLVKLAELVHFNPSYLSRLFKRVTGENVSDYINRIRVAKAIELLKNPDMKVQQAASAVGFESVSYFNRVFKKIVGTTPQLHRDTFHNKSKYD